MTRAHLCAIPDEFETAWEIGGEPPRTLEAFVGGRVLEDAA